MLKKIILFLSIFSSLCGGINYNGIDYTEQDMPIIVDGETEQHVVTAGEIEYINSWSMKFLKINNQDYANQYITYIPVKVNGMYFIDYIPRNKSGHFEMVGNTNWEDTVIVEQPHIDTLSILLPYVHEGKDQIYFEIEGIPYNINSWGMDSLLVNNIEYKNQYLTIFPERINNKYYIYYKAVQTWSHFEINGSNEIYSDEIDTVYINESFIYDGIGKKVFIPTFFINHINSWLADSISVNGEDITNRYTSTFPDTINGNYYIYYESSNIDAGISIGLTDQALSVELLNISGEQLPGGILLKWATASETENLRFDVYNADSLLLGAVPGSGTTTNINEYEFLDTAPKQGKNSYIIKEIGYNGKEKIMATVTITSSEELVDIYPNPANPSINLIFNNFYNTSKRVSIYNLNGKLIKDYEFDQFTQKITLSTNNLESGIYIMMVNNRYSGKFSVVK